MSVCWGALQGTLPDDADRTLNPMQKAQWPSD